MPNRRGSLLVSAWGDPRDAKTWSGTPAKITDGLEQRGWRVSGADVKLQNKLQRFCLFAHYQAERMLQFRNSPAIYLRQILNLSHKEDFNRSAKARAASAKLTAAAARDSRPSGILHIGTLALPAVHSGSQRNFLLCDSTWGLAEPYLIQHGRFSPTHLEQFRRLEREAYASMDHIFTIGEHVRDSLTRDYGIAADRVTATGSGRGNISPYFGKKQYADGYILFVAKVRIEEKGLALLLEGFARARVRNPKLRLVIAGHDSYPQRVRDLDGVTGHGSISWDHLQKLFREAALFAMPARFEPWGLVYLEALACRTPILGLNRLAFPEISGCGNYGFAVGERPDDIAEALLHAFNNPLRLQHMGDEGQKFCLEKYSWDIVCNKMDAAMSAAIQRI